MFAEMVCCDLPVLRGTSYPPGGFLAVRGVLTTLTVRLALLAILFSLFSGRHATPYTFREIATTLGLGFVLVFRVDIAPVLLTPLFQRFLWSFERHQFV